MKLAQRDELKEKQRLKKAGISMDDVANGNENGENASDNDLFEDDDNMNLG